MVNLKEIDSQFHKISQSVTSECRSDHLFTKISQRITCTRMKIEEVSKSILPHCIVSAQICRAFLSVNNDKTIVDQAKTCTGSFISCGSPLHFFYNLKHLQTINDLVLKLAIQYVQLYIFSFATSEDLISLINKVVNILRTIIYDQEHSLLLTRYLKNWADLAEKICFGRT